MVFYLAHGSNEKYVLKGLPVEVLAPVVHSSLLQQQLEEGNRLLGPIGVHLRHIHIINEYDQLLA